MPALMLCWHSRNKTSRLSRITQSTKNQQHHFKPPPATVGQASNLPNPVQSPASLFPKAHPFAYVPQIHDLVSPSAYKAATWQQREA
jgi:hypothetical protein